MELLSASEIQKIQDEFDKEVKGAILGWAILTLADIKRKIMEKNTGNNSVISGTIQVAPHEIHLSKELSQKIKSSRKNFHTGDNVFRHLMEDCQKTVLSPYGPVTKWFRVGRGSWFIYESQDEPQLSYYLFFSIGPKNYSVEKQKGFFFKRTVTVTERFFELDDISLKFIKKLKELCENEGIKIVGAEALYCSSEIMESSVTINENFEKVSWNIEGYNEYLPVVLKWEYRHTF